MRRGIERSRRGKDEDTQFQNIKGVNRFSTWRKKEGAIRKILFARTSDETPPPDFPTFSNQGDARVKNAVLRSHTTRGVRSNLFRDFRGFPLCP